MTTRDVTVQVTMTLRVDDGQDAVEAAWRWLPYPRELPLGCSDGVTLTSIDVRPAAPEYADGASDA